MRIIKFWLVAAAFASIFTVTVRADEVTDWNQNMFKAALAATPPTSALFMTRVAAIVQASVFDAVNGIERRYTPIHVNPNSSRRIHPRRSRSSSLRRSCEPVSRPEE